MDDDGYCVSTNASVCVVCFSRPYRRRVWEMLIDDPKFGLKKGDLVISDPINNGAVHAGISRMMPLNRFLIVEWYTCKSGKDINECRQRTR